MVELLDSLETNSQIDSYRIEALIASSGMASIYRATDPVSYTHLDVYKRQPSHHSITR